jgi:CheY-like chemotaxis protein
MSIPSAVTSLREIAPERPLILLVDDQADVRFMLSLWLEDEGVDFEEATSGEEALERTDAKPYDLILLDQRMPPGMSGIEVAETMRSNGKQVPIVLYSAYLDPAVEERAHELGLTTIDKGEPDRLMQAIRNELAA